MDAPERTAKKFETSAIQQFLKSKEKHVVTVASSAVAAQKLGVGRAAHSGFRIKIPVGQESVCRISIDLSFAEELRQIDLIVWGEIVMSHRCKLKAADRTLRDITRYHPLVGIPVLLIDDSHQILPALLA